MKWRNEGVAAPVTVAFPVEEEKKGCGLQLICFLEALLVS
jgi:hypothetical protein